MKRLLCYIVAGCLLAGCNANKSKPSENSAAVPDQSAAQTASAKPINQYCPINKDDKIDPTVTTVYKGQVIGFCCSDCIPEFKKDPEKYMKTLK